jgi:hypothetical protein
MPKKNKEKNFISHTYACVPYIPPNTPFEEALPSGNQF